jgi:aminoglycoside/choline kinase family phosphotransferase
MLPEALLRQTMTRFPRFAKSAIAIERLEKGGSDRSYYRIRVTDEHSLILVKYGAQREENRHYVAIAQFLKSVGVNVPEIYFHDEMEQLIWMQDLGERDLWCFRDESWTVRRELYERALDQAILLHTKAHRALPRSGLTLQVEFDAELYRWEQNYFFENCLGRFFHIDDEVIAERCDRAALGEIADQLGGQPRVLVHRDFQSQNVMIHEDCAHLIDFQGLRPGLMQYDLASMVYDPYVALTPDEREELVCYFAERLFEAGFTPAGDFRTVLDLCAVQRLMQALGAYGFLGLVKERTAFLDHVPAALASLKTILARVPCLQSLRTILEELP